ncbi:disease resistance protein RPV1-like [Prosopis cineraria]|uniref:disease resistance protein RPV1-like n=1 Tax=Prosopis cineraria TaxID=364024 RepID=UPI00240F3526|nr:disease resistance protein RPV1-like [Prosopis cineraria]XP_054813001.1 disease resistance protein RPV1-like [Prosopis cineraria]XP_054813002.1 disease resistance protein RPV1-like [Prosopis cineraria]
MTTQASTSSPIHDHWNYDVFINFRGGDTRYGFTGNLYKALDEKGIHTFFDDREIRMGDEIDPKLHEAIEESRMFICVFSKDYATSRFCLDELVHIHQCSKRDGRRIWPIFYDVEPSEVRHQKGNYARALDKYKSKNRADENKMENWKAALRDVANISGKHFTPGRIIITTRDMQLLAKHGIKRKYEMEALNDKESLELLSGKAFRSMQVPASHKEVVKNLMHYAQGLPLALEVIGSNLQGKTVREWESALNQYERIPNKKIHQILKVSYDGLELFEKEIFLDIACFFNELFKGRSLNYVKEMEERVHNLDPHYSISVLEDKCLIKTEVDRIRMHDLIQDMGRQIVHQESPNRPEKRTRLWLNQDIVQVLEENTGTNKVRMIASENLSKCREVIWDGKAFEKMKNLKILCFKNLKFSEGPKYLPNSLKVLKWEEYPSSSLPPNFRARELFVMNVPHSRLKSVEFKMALNLSVLNLKECQNITQISDLSGISNLKKLNLHGCKNLIAVDDSVGELERLEVLNVEKCAKLKTFPHCIKSPCLKSLDLSQCSSLKYFPEILPKVPLRTLDVWGSGIEKLPACIKECMSLEEFWLSECKHLQEVEGIPPNLEWLVAQNCVSLSLESRSLLLSKEVIGAGIRKHGACCSKNFVMLGSIIPEWMDVCKKGGSISFWFRNVIPTFCCCALLTPSADYECDFDFGMRINGILVNVRINGRVFHNISLIKEDSIFLCIPDRDKDYERRQVLKGGVWNNAEISIRQHSSDLGGVKESGIYMIRQHCNMEDIRFTGPLNLDSLNIDQECMEHLAEYLETVFDLSKSSCRDWVECMREESIPEWFHKRTKGQDVSFCFRNNFPTLYGGALQNSDYNRLHPLSISINGCHFCKAYYSSLKLGNTVVYGLQLASFDEKEMKRAFREGEWNYVKIRVYDAKESGIYVTGQQYNKEDIRFTDPDMDAMANQESWCRLESWCGLDDDDDDEDEDEDEDVEGEQPMLKKRWLMEDNHVISISSYIYILNLNIFNHFIYPLPSVLIN